MDQPPKSGEAHHEATTNNTDPFSRSYSHRPGQGGVHPQYESRHQGAHPSGFHHYDPPQHLSESRDVRDNDFSSPTQQHSRPHHRTAPSLGPTHSLAPPHDQHHPEGRMLGGGAHGPGGSFPQTDTPHLGGFHGHNEASHSGRPPNDTDYGRQGGPYHQNDPPYYGHPPYGEFHQQEALPYGRPYRPPYGEDRTYPSFEGSDQPGGPLPPLEGEYHKDRYRQGHRAHREHRENRERRRGGRRHREHHRDESQFSFPDKSHSTLGASHAHLSAKSWDHYTASMIHSHASHVSSRTHPHEGSGDSESWSEDEQFQRHKGRSQRLHKKAHSGDFFHWLWEKLSYLIWVLRTMMRKLTQSLAFEAYIFFTICLNTVVVVAHTFSEVEIRAEWYFLVLDCIFLGTYMVEAIVKIIALGMEYFYDPWNNLDFFIMIITILDFMLMQVNSLTYSFYNHSLFRIIKVFKGLRALRAIRVLRRLSILTSLHEVTGTLGRSLRSIMAILILMFACIFLFSVVLRALFRKSDPRRFHTFFDTIFTLFSMLTLDDWSYIYRDNRAEGAWYIVPILMIYIVIQCFIFLNLVIAVLVDSFQMALLRHLEKIKQERAAKIHEKLLDDSLTELTQAEAEEVISETTLRKHLIERKFGTMTEKQQEVHFHFLQLVAGVEQQQQKFRSQASVIDEIVDTAFEAGEEDFRK